MSRQTTPITTNQAVRAFRRLELDDQERIRGAAEKLQEKAKLKFTEALQVFAEVGMYLVTHE
jgi:hypothetical protein